MMSKESKGLLVCDSSDSSSRDARDVGGLPRLRPDVGECELDGCGGVDCGDCVCDGGCDGCWDGSGAGCWDECDD